MTVREKGEGVLAPETGAQEERTGGEEETDEPLMGAGAWVEGKVGELFYF